MPSKAFLMKRAFNYAQHSGPQWNELVFYHSVLSEEDNVLLIILRWEILKKTYLNVRNLCQRGRLLQHPCCQFIYCFPSFWNECIISKARMMTMTIIIHWEGVIILTSMTRFTMMNIDDPLRRGMERDRDCWREGKPSTGKGVESSPSFPTFFTPFPIPAYHHNIMSSSFKSLKSSHDYRITAVQPWFHVQMVHPCTFFCLLPWDCCHMEHICSHWCLCKKGDCNFSLRECAKK